MLQTWLRVAALVLAPLLAVGCSTGRAELPETEPPSRLAWMHATTNGLSSPPYVIHPVEGSQRPAEDELAGAADPLIELPRDEIGAQRYVDLLGALAEHDVDPATHAAIARAFARDPGVRQRAWGRVGDLLEQGAVESALRALADVAALQRAFGAPAEEIRYRKDLLRELGEVVDSGNEQAPAEVKWERREHRVRATDSHGRTLVEYDVAEGVTKAIDVTDEHAIFEAEVAGGLRVLALNTDGSRRWSVRLPSAKWWDTPTYAYACGFGCVFAAGNDGVVALDAETGRVRWLTAHQQWPELGHSTLVALRRERTKLTLYHRKPDRVPLELDVLTGRVRLVLQQR